MDANARYGGCGAGCGCHGSRQGWSPAKDIAESLKELGYAAEVDGDLSVNVADKIDGSPYKIVIVSNPTLTELMISCQVDTLGSAGITAEAQRDYLFHAININDNIAPFATTVIENNGSDPLVVLVSRAETLDQGPGEITDTLRWQLQQLRRAVLYFNQQVLQRLLPA